MSKIESSSEDLAESLKNLTDALEAGSVNFTPISASPALQIQDLSSVARPYLSASTRYDMSKKSMQLTVVENNEVFRCIYLAARVVTGNEEKAVIEISKALNDLSSQGLIHSCLAPISSLRLALTTSVPQSVVFAYVLVPRDAVADCEAKYGHISIQEGEAGKALDDMKPQLQPGEFLATIRVSFRPAMLSNPPDYKELVHKAIQDYLRYLPENTRVRQVTELAVTDLSYPFEVKFFNPIMQNIKRVELEYIRQVAKFDDNYVHQFNLLTGIRYFDSDDRDITSK